MKLPPGPGGGGGGEAAELVIKVQIFSSKFCVKVNVKELPPPLLYQCESVLFKYVIPSSEYVQLR